jgi:arylsulfatase A-like enzyme
MTGKYPARLHLTDWLPGRPDLPSQKLRRPPIQDHLPLDEVTLASALHEAGYTTAFIGKWHLGGKAFYPEHFGFDANIGGCELGHPPSYFSPYKNPTLPDGPKGEYLTDRLTDEAIKFIDRAQQTPDKPFLLYLCHYAVHNPQQAKAEAIARYKAKAATHPPAGPEFVTDLGRQVRVVQDQPVYAAMVESLDESVGRIIKALADRGLDRNTVVIFTSDNGGLSTAEGTPTSNDPLRGGKGWPYEGGVREPLIVKWPGMTKPGSVCAAPMISTDYYPTFLEMAGLPLRPAQHLDGVSIVPLLKGEAMLERPIYWHYPHYSNQGGSPCGTIRQGDFKLIEWYEDDRAELFNIHDDIGEKHDLSQQSPEKAAELRKQLKTWREAVKADMPTPNPDYKPNQRRAESRRPALAGLGADDDD